MKTLPHVDCDLDLRRQITFLLKFLTHLDELSQMFGTLGVRDNY